MRRNRTTWACLFLMTTAALIVTGGCENRPPDAPFLLGPAEGKVGEGLSFSLSSVDPDRDPVACRVAWGDGDTSDWSPAAFSGDTVRLTHTWSSDDVYSLYGQAKDQHGIVSDWSERLTVEVLPGDSNQPPSAPVLLGPEEGNAGDNLSFLVSSVDPDSDLVAYRIWWDDGSISEWSEAAFSGDTVALTHSWLWPDGYRLQAQAKDQHGRLSDWSHDLWLGIMAPGAPSAPVLLGPTTGGVGESLSYSVSAIDPDGDLVAFRIAWGDGSRSDWSPAVFSGDTVSLAHSWASGGAYSLYAQAKDQHGNESEWSAGLTLQVGTSGYPDTIIATIDVGGDPHDMVKLASGPYLYIANESFDGIIVVNVDELRVVDTISCGGVPWGITASPDDKYVYVSNHYENTVKVISTQTNEVVASIPVGEVPSGLACTPDGRYVYVVNVNSDNVSVIRTSDNSVVATVDVGHLPYGLCLPPNGEYVYTANMEGNVTVIRTSDNSVVKTISFPSQVGRATPSRDSRYVYISGGKDSVTVIRTSDNTIVGAVPTASPALKGCYLRGGDYVYVACPDADGLTVINTADNTVADTIHDGDGCWAVASSGDGERVYTVNRFAQRVSVLVRR